MCRFRVRRPNPVAQGAAALAAHYDVPVEVMPLAADVLKFGSGSVQRIIDVIGYGRQQREHSDLLSATFKQPGSARTYYHTDHATAGAVIDFYSHRRFFRNHFAHAKQPGIDAVAANGGDVRVTSVSGQHRQQPAADERRNSQGQPNLSR